MPALELSASFLDQTVTVGQLLALAGGWLIGSFILAVWRAR